MRRIFAAFILAVILVSGISFARAGEAVPPPAAASGKTYQQALQEAEKDLRRMEEGGKAEPGGWTLSDFLALAALLAAIGLMFWASRWTRRLFFRPAAGREMRILDRVAIGRNSTLLLVELRGRVYWLADSPAGVARLDDWPAEKAGATPPPPPAGDTA